MSSGFLSARLTDQNEQRVWRVCSRWVFVVAVVLPTFVACTTTVLSRCCERKKKQNCCAGWELLSLHSPSCGPRLENLFLIAACPCDLVSVACFASVNSKKEASVFQSEQRKAAEFHTREQALQQRVNQRYGQGSNRQWLGKSTPNHQCK